MIDFLITGIVLLFLCFILVFQSKYEPEGNSRFFDVNNSKAMRGFWCLVIILVHIPPAFQNRLSDMIGSFAYIGVTFFFMTSAYGLSLSQQKQTATLKGFWLNRLPKLIIPCWIVNILLALFNLALLGKKPDIFAFIGINRWVLWLLGCYLLFWIAHKFIKNPKVVPWVICSTVLAISLAIYFLAQQHIITGTTWCPESIGFIWGVVLAVNYKKIKDFFVTKWLWKVIVSCLLAGILGLLYLKFKPIVFWGNYVLKVLLGLSILTFILILNSKMAIGNKILSFLGDISFEIFLIHSSLMALIATLLPTLRSGYFVMLSLAISILLAWVSHIISTFLIKKLYTWASIVKVK